MSLLMHTLEGNKVEERVHTLGLSYALLGDAGDRGRFEDVEDPVGRIIVKDGERISTSIPVLEDD